MNSPTVTDDRDAALDTADDTVDETEPRLIEDELLVEEISIDGMCGVY